MNKEFGLPNAPTVRRPAIPRTVWVLGLVSMFMDISSEMIHALLPLFLTVTLGASVALVGVIDGVAEATASISKMFSGYLSDRIGQRKPLILMGYGLGALSKPLFALAGSAGLVFGARFADRIGKGLRGAPRDALVADVTPLEIRGRAYGLRQSLDTVGAFTGPLAAIGLMIIFANDMRSVFWFAAIPGFIAVALVIFGIEGRSQEPTIGKLQMPLRLRDLRQFSNDFWAVVGIGVMFTMARFSEAFLVLKANADGLPLAFTPLVLVVMNEVYSLGAYPAGALADARGLIRHMAVVLKAQKGLFVSDNKAGFPRRPARRLVRQAIRSISASSGVFAANTPAVPHTARFLRTNVVFHGSLGHDEGAETKLFPRPSIRPLSPGSFPRPDFPAPLRSRRPRRLRTSCRG